MCGSYTFHRCVYVGRLPITSIISILVNFIHICVLQLKHELDQYYVFRVPCFTGYGEKINSNNNNTINHTERKLNRNEKIEDIYWQRKRNRMMNKCLTARSCIVIVPSLKSRCLSRQVNEGKL